MNITTGDTSAERTAHTPGPWELHQNINGVNSLRVCIPDTTVDRGCRPVAEAEILGMDRCEAEANARLIATAPELLALAKEIEQLVTNDSDDRGFHLRVVPIRIETVRALRSAIAKAEGAQ